jgi:hypothetical protein
MPLTPEERDSIKKDYKEVVRFYYTKANKLVIASERLDKEQRLSGAAITELRAVLAHLMRVDLVLFDLVNESKIKEKTGLSLFEYCRKNIDKAKGHLFRAAYDAYDVMAISLAEKIIFYLDSISTDALYTIVPNATNEIALPFREAQDMISHAKVEKDIGTWEEEKQEFRDYERSANALEAILSKIEEVLPNLVKYDNELKRKNRTHLLLAVIGLIIGLIGIGFAIFSIKA